MFAGVTVLIACIGMAVVVAAVVTLLVMLSRQDAKRQADPYLQAPDASAPPPAGSGQAGPPTPPQ